MLDVVYRPKALADIDIIADYTIREWGARQAKAYVEDIRKQIELTAEFPGIGSAVHGLPQGYRKLAAGSHRVIYRVTGPEVLVVRILHQREDVPDDLTA